MQVQQQQQTSSNNIKEYQQGTSIKIEILRKINSQNHHREVAA